MNSKKNNEFGIERKKQLEELHSHITDKNTYDNKTIKVFSIEASVGKTTQLTKSLKWLAKYHPNIKTLVVTKFIDEGEDLVKKLGKKKAIAINSKTKMKLSFVKYDDIKDINVVVITHQAYRRICYGKIKPEIFTKGRTNLIIDEELNLVKINELNDILIDNIREILSKMPSVPVDLKAEILDNRTINVFNSIINEIKTEKDKNFSGTMKFFSYKTTFDANKATDDLIDMIYRSAKEHKGFWTNIRNKSSGITTHNQLINDLYTIKSFFGDKKVIAYNSKLYTYDDNVNYYLLENNILLDASAKLNYIYEISSKFKLYDFKRIIDHSNWTIHICNENSSSSSKLNSRYFYKSVEKMLIDKANKEDEILVILKEDDKKYVNFELFEDLKNNHYEFSNFENMRGKNIWGKYNKCFIIHTPQLAAHYYIFEYLYYNPKIKLFDADIIVEKKNKHMCFANNELEKIKIGDIVSCIYQGIKRISRNPDMSKNADVYLFNNNDAIIDVLIKQFVGIKVENIEVNKQYNSSIEKRRYNSTLRKKNSLLIERVDKLLAILKDGNGNKFKKSDLRQQLDNINRKSFSRVLQNKKMVKFLSTNGFVVDQRHYIFKNTEN